MHPGLRLEGLTLRKPVTGSKLLQTVKNVLQTSKAFAPLPAEVDPRTNNYLKQSAPLNVAREAKRIHRSASSLWMTSR